ncbi:MAG: LytR C-terminal domain-containing protein [Patescibacteria group bacterium]|nr:LytR C-terminal domain-containing protein [Patescibacteria group bacterium]
MDNYLVSVFSSGLFSGIKYQPQFSTLPLLLTIVKLKKMNKTAQSEYYLQVVKGNEEPIWPQDEGELIIGSQPLDGHYIQHWAYHRDSGKSPHRLPQAEITASEYPVREPVILIDQPKHEEGSRNGDELELILAKDGHAWGRTESSIANLEDNITAILEYAQSELGMRVENFMTSKNVSPRVEKALDELENSEGQGEDIFEKNHNAESLRSLGGSDQTPFYPRGSSGSSSKRWLVLPVILIFVAFGGVIHFREKISTKLANFSISSAQPTPTPVSTPTPTPTPTPVAIDRSQYQVRLLNGTTKTGAASKLADELKGLGWQILKTGNATDQATLHTLVRVKSDGQDLAKAMISDLKPDLTATSSANLKASDKADIEVVIGKD